MLHTLGSKWTTQSQLSLQSTPLWTRWIHFHNYWAVRLVLCLTNIWVFLCVILSPRLWIFSLCYKGLNQGYWVALPCYPLVTNWPSSNLSSPVCPLFSCVHFGSLKQWSSRSILISWTAFGENLVPRIEEWLWFLGIKFVSPNLMVAWESLIYISIIRLCWWNSSTNSSTKMTHLGSGLYGKHIIKMVCHVTNWWAHSGGKAFCRLCLNKRSILDLFQERGRLFCCSTTIGRTYHVI